MAVKFLKKGKASKKALDNEEKKAEEQSKNTAFRFWMPNDAETEVTFLDGDLDEEGLLDIPMYYEHQVFMNGRWTNWFVCTGEEEPCPVCEGGDNPALVGAFTIIDHSQYKDKNGKQHKDERRLFVAKRQSIKMLQKLATKREGLAGCKFDVSRTGEQSASVGNIYDFTDKTSLIKIKKLYGKECVPYDYEQVIQYRSAKELRKLGFGSTAVGAEDDDGAGSDYDEDL